MPVTVQISSLADGQVINWAGGAGTIGGNVTIGGNLTVSGTTTTTVNQTIAGNVTLTQPASTSGSPTALTVTGAAHTTLTASTEATDINFNLARTVQFATGALATQRAVRFQAPTYAFVAASTITDAATVSISGAPVAGLNATITNAAALVVESGNVGFGTPSPGKVLDIVKADDANIRIAHDPTYYAYLQHTGMDVYNNPLQLKIGGSEKMRISTDGNVGFGTPSPDRLLHSEATDAGTNTILYPLRLTRISSGTPAAGIGAGLELEVETAADNNEIGAVIEAVTTDVTSTSEDFDLVFKLMAAGAAAAEKFRIISNGTLQFGTHASIVGETLSGFITINDSGGTPRKVAVVS